MNCRRLERLGVAVVAIALGVGLSSAAVAVLESTVGVANASSLYLVTVAAIAILLGVLAAAATSVVSVLVYDYWFTHPVHTLTVSDPGEWLNLVLLLFVAVTVGELAGLQRRRAEMAIARDHESRALFEVTRALAARDSTQAAMPAIAEALARAGGLRQVWFAGGSDDADERVIAQSAPGALPAPTRGHAVLHRTGTGGGPTWTTVRGPTPGGQRVEASMGLFRVRIEEGGRPIGSLWATRERSLGPPDAATTRLLRVAADLVGQALAHDRLEEQTRRAEVAQQSDALKSALVESVSHDLRTPLASIRASAGTLMDPDVELSPGEARASAASIDREAKRLNRLVGNLLDLGRIEGGALRAAEDALDLEDVATRAIEHVLPRAGTRAIEVDIVEGTAVLGDAVLLEEAIVNLLDNAFRHTPLATRVRVTGAEDGPLVRMTVEDAGPGVPDAALPRVFDKFFRAGRPPGGGRGTGIGLAVVRGFVDAMGGHVEARRSELGGLAVDVELRAARLPATAESGS